MRRFKVDEATVMPGPEQSGQVAEQNASYRRGVVLGLTMAEAAILIIFVLLLLIGLGEQERAASDVAASASVTVERTRLTQLESIESTLKAVLEQIGLPAAASTEEITALVRGLVNAAKTKEARENLERIQKVLDELRQIREELNKGSQDGQGPGDRLERQSAKIGNLEGELKRLQALLAKANITPTERPCWVDATATIDFLFDVVLDSRGIRMRETSLPGRAKERERLPMPNTDPNEVLSIGEFLNRTRPLFDHSIADKCRHYVTVFDATGPTEKEKFKTLLLTVEGHFYKKLSREPAPF